MFDISRLLSAAALLGAVASHWSPFPSAAVAAPADIEIKGEVDRGLLVQGEARTGYLRVAITPARRPDSKRAPLNLTLVIDRSGSMSAHARMENARRAAELAVDRMGRDDILSIVSYDDKVQVELPATKLTDPGDAKARISRLTPRGSTAIHAGLLAGANEIRKFKSKDRVNRIILLSDGLANVGPAKPADFVSLGRELGSEGIAVSTIGLGNGYNEDLMAGLAKAADGGHVFVQESADLTAFLARELDDAAGTVGQDAEIIIRAKSGVTPIRTLGRDARIEGDRVIYKVGTLLGGVEQVLIVEAKIDASASLGSRDLAEVEIKFTEAATGRRVETHSGIVAEVTSEKERAETSGNATVIRDVATIQSRAVRAEAVKLRDAGQVEEARQKFLSNSASLKALQQSVPGLVLSGPLKGEIEASEAAAAPAAQSAEGWSKARKIQRENDGYKSGASAKF